MTKDTPASESDEKPGKSELKEARRAAELHLLTKIASSTGGPARDLAEAYALLTGRRQPTGKKKRPAAS